MIGGGGGWLAGLDLMLVVLSCWLWWWWVKDVECDGVLESLFLGWYWCLCYSVPILTTVRECGLISSMKRNLPEPTSDQHPKRILKASGPSSFEENQQRCPSKVGERWPNRLRWKS
jgi:hypothetical protein